MSLPPPPVNTLALPSPVMLSLFPEPVTFSMPESVSEPSAPEADPEARLTVTAPLAFAAFLAEVHAIDL